MDDFDKAEFAKKAMESKLTPLDYWSKEVDPAIMAGDEWVDEDADFGNVSEENEEMKRGIMTQSSIFMHPVHDVSFKKD